MATANLLHLSEHHYQNSIITDAIDYINNYISSSNVIADVNITDICQKCSNLSIICKLMDSSIHVVDSIDKSVKVSGSNMPLHRKPAFPTIVLDLLWQIIRNQIMGHINVSSFPELIYLVQEGEEVSSFSLISPEDILLRWLNYHLRKADSSRTANNFTTDLSDSEIYGVVINGLNPVVCKQMHWEESDHMKRADHAIMNAKALGVTAFIKPSDICDANEKLNLMFVAQLFNASNGLPKNEDQNGVEMKRVQELPVQKGPVPEREREPNWQAIAEELHVKNAAKTTEIESLRQQIVSLRQDLALMQPVAGSCAIPEQNVFAASSPIESKGNNGNTVAVANVSNKLLSKRYRYCAPNVSPLRHTSCAGSDYERDNAHSQPRIFRSARDLRVESDSRVTSFLFCDIDTSTHFDDHYESSKQTLKMDRKEVESDSRDSVPVFTDLQMLDSELSHGSAEDDDSHEVYFAMKKSDMQFLLREYNSRRLSLRSTSIPQDITTQHMDDDSSTYSDVVECENDFFSGVELSSSSWKTVVANYTEKVDESPLSFDCGSVDTDEYMYDAHGDLEFNKQFVGEDNIQVYDWEFWEAEDRNRTYLSDTIVFHQAAETSTEEITEDITEGFLINKSSIYGSVCVFDDANIDTFSISDSYSCREDEIGDDYDYDDDDDLEYDGSGDGDDDGDIFKGRCSEDHHSSMLVDEEFIISVDDFAATYDAPLPCPIAPTIDLPTTEDIDCAKADTEAGDASTYIQSRHRIHHHWLLLSTTACIISVCCWALFFPSSTVLTVDLKKQGGSSQASITDTDTVKNTTIGMPIVPSTSSLISSPAAAAAAGRNISVKVLFAPIAKRSAEPPHTFIHQLLKLAIMILCGMPEEHSDLLGLH